ncbi:MAG: hypothetical protein AB7E24_12500 [Novosphingobium sp.]
MKAMVLLRFVFAYTPAEFAQALAMIGTERAALSPMVTGSVALQDLDAAFASLTDGDSSQIKRLVRPS